MVFRKQNIPKTLKNKVWDTYIGQQVGTGNCYCCGGCLDSKNFECGHVQAEAKGGKLSIRNLRPICLPCNRSMGTQNMHKFMKKCGFINKHSWNYRINMIIEMIMVCFFILIIIGSCFDVFMDLKYYNMVTTYLSNWYYENDNNNKFYSSFVNIFKN
jgi:hypothetical protein